MVQIQNVLQRIHCGRVGFQLDVLFGGGVGSGQGCLCSSGCLELHVDQASLEFRDPPRTTGVCAITTWWC